MKKLLAALIVLAMAGGASGQVGSYTTTANKITVSNEATDTTCFPLFVNSATGIMTPKTNVGLTFNSATGALGATGFTGAITARVVGVTSSATPTPNATTTDIYTITALAEAAVFGTPTGTPVNGQKIEIRIYAAAIRALDFASSGAYAPIGCTMPTATAAGKWTYVIIQYNSTAAKWHMLAVAQES
jgi:hypothetical protein